MDTSGELFKVSYGAKDAYDMTLKKVDIINQKLAKRFFEGVDAEIINSISLGCFGVSFGFIRDDISEIQLDKYKLELPAFQEGLKVLRQNGYKVSIEEPSDTRDSIRYINITW